jgi:hypothetical protein
MTMSANIPLTTPQLEFALELRVAIGPTADLGTSSLGSRRTVPITGGSFEGPLIAGRVLPGGADWQLVEPDGLTHLDARYAIETTDGVRIEVRNRGIRYGSSEIMARIAAGEAVASHEYYFRTAPRFYLPAGHYDWLLRSIFVGVCERFANLVIVRVWKLL